MTMVPTRLLPVLALLLLAGCDSPLSSDSDDDGETPAVDFRYEVVPLADIPGDSVTPVDLNESGHVLARAKAATGEWHSYLVRDGAVVDLGAVTANDLNDAGQVVGNAGWHADPFLWEDDVFLPIPVCVGMAQTVYVLNDEGQVSGRCGTRAFVWDRGEPDVEVLPHDDRILIAWPTDINARGAMIGTAYGDLVDLVIVWRDGTGRILHAGRNPHAGTAINDAGYSVGYSRMGRGHSPVASYLWTPEGEAADLGTLIGERTHHDEWTLGRTLEQTWALDLNEAREVVGRATDTDGEWRGFLWTDGAILDLNDLLVDEGWTVTSAVRIDEQGDVLATTRAVGSEQESAVLLRRTPARPRGRKERRGRRDGARAGRSAGRPATGTHRVDFLSGSVTKWVTARSPVGIVDRRPHTD